MIRCFEKRLRQTAGMSAKAPDLVVTTYVAQPGEFAGLQMGATVHEGIYLEAGYLSWTLTADQAEAHAANLLACAEAARSNAALAQNHDAAAAHYTALAAAARDEPAPTTTNPREKPMTETNIKTTAIAAIAFASLPPLGAELAGGTFHGITTDRAGAHFAVVLIDAKPDGRMAWKDATAWAESVGGQLPTRPVAALLYANAKPLLNPAWHWTSDTLEADTGGADDASFAWDCHFDDGTQGCDHKSASGAAVAVRLIPLSA